MKKNEKTITPKDILVYARDLLAKGWTQGRWKQCDCYCAGEAIRQAALHFSGEGLYESYAMSSNWERDEFWTIVEWNDKPRRTKRQVLAAFDRAIADC